MTYYYPTLQVTIFISVFFVVYIALLLQRVVRSQVDLYDFFMLGGLGTIPLLFVLFPRFVSRLTQLVGVEFPFLLLFGALSSLSFLLIYRLIRRANRLRREVVRLIQEVGMLKHEVQALSASRHSAAENARKVEVSSEL